MIPLVSEACVPTVSLPSRAMRTVLALAAALTLLALTACTADDANSSTTPPAADSPSPTPMPIPADCTPATPEDVQAIEAALTEPATLTDAYTTQLDAYRYVMANVDRPDGSRLTSADIWVFDQAGSVYAGTSSAVDYSTSTDADAIPDADRYGNTDQVHALQDCVTASAQQRNHG